MYKVMTMEDQPHRKKYLNQTRELFEGPPEMRAALLPAQERMFAQVKELRGKLAEKHRAGKLTREKAKEAHFQVYQDYYLAQEQAKAEVDARFEALGKKWKAEHADAVKELLSLQRHKLRYDSLTKREVSDAIAEYLVSPDGRHPDEVKALEAAAIRVGSANLQDLRKTMAKADYERPWMSQAPELTKLRHLYDAPLGKVRCLGPLGTDEYNIEELFDTTPVEGEDDGE